MYKLDCVVANNIKTTKDNFNGSIDNEPMFDFNSFNLPRGTRDPLPVVTISQ